MQEHEYRPSLRDLALAPALAALLLTGCPSPEEVPIAEEVLGPVGSIVPHASAAQRATFDRGREVALRRFALEDGLGPSFNLTTCGGCHERPLVGGGAAHYRDFLLVQQRLSDGSQSPVGINGIQVQFDRDERRMLDAEGANVLATRNPIPFFGTGALAEIDEAAILAHADPDDADGDGISGRPNFDRGFVGRFGRKSQTVSVEGFIRGPLFNHLGLTSDPLTDEMKARLPVPSAAPAGAVRRGDASVVIAAQASAPDEPTTDDDGIPDPELSAEDLFDLVSFAMLLAAPEPEPPTLETEEGRALFESINCSGCHVPALRGPRGMVPAYSDLLLHDMGEDLADGIRMGVAQGNEFRTQPLWGIIAVGPYLHDGRASTLDEAIRAHGGEAQRSRDAYEALSETERALVIAFLESLGGREQYSEGLLPQDAPVLPVGAYGGPQDSLAGDDLARFLRGRAAFDLDRSATLGLGPGFNGDSCRACHFDPVIGGSGPADVNVTRQAILGTGMSPVAPSGGTMAHRFRLGAMRPPIDPASDFFELRQTPSLFGLGLIDEIPEALIVAAADPDDLDGDGISGRPHRLADGRLGRLGWKADVPSLAEFARDGMANELGVSLPVQPGLTFGVTSDSDDVGDPEISLEDLEALVFFMQSLAAPPRTRTDMALEDRGEIVFAEVGCDGCHSTLALADGTPVRLFSDLLLHDVYPPGEQGIGSGDASGRELRTAPLWGLATTGPYMHDGLSGTIEDAIARHSSEGATSSAAVAALSAADREALLAFLASL